MALRSFRSFAGPSLVSLLLAGCGSRDEVACDYAVCAIVEESCIERVAEAVGCHLEQDIIYPEVRFLTAEAYLAEIEASTAPLTAEEERDRADYLRAEALLGLMPEGYAPEEASADFLRNVAALYSPERKDIVIIADHAFSDVRGDYMVLVHEMVHAYQDVAWDLAALGEQHAPTFDRFLGLRALIEGAAVMYQNLAYIELDGYRPQDIDWAGFFGEWQDDRLQRAAETETPALDTTILFPYAFGGELVLDAWLDGGPGRLDALSRRPPDSVRQVLGGYPAWPDELVNGDAAFDPRAVAVMPAGYALITGGHESVWSINAMLQRTAGGGVWARELDAVSADYLAAWRWGDEVVAMWRIGSARPEELLAALTRPGSRWVAAELADSAVTHLVTTVDSDVLLIAVSGGDARTVLAEIAGWQSIADAYMTGEAAVVRAADLMCAAAPVRPRRSRG